MSAELNTLAEKTTELSHHLYPLISDLGLILMTAGVAILIFKKIKQPLVLGYLIAGFLAGPHFTLFPTVKEVGNVEVWAEIGVIILLFSLGLEFSFKKLMKVGGTASVTAGVQIVSMIVIGYLVGWFLGWSQIDSIFLGAMLSMSSTTIILRAFDELGVKTQKFAGVVFGTLIIEDIVAILLMVLLATISVSQNFSGVALMESSLKLIFFLILWFLAGIFLIPTLLKKVKPLLNDETLLIVSLALCLMMVMLATSAGFSPALGAFIMGSIIAETTKAEQIEHIIKPVKDLFGAVFFVSVGMLINIDTLKEYAIPVVIITLVTIVGKALSTAGGALLSGQPLKQSVQAGMSLAQIGEFSFIIATLGMTLGVISDFLYPIIVAVSAITTFTTPFMIKKSVPTYLALQKIIPQNFQDRIEQYSSNTEGIKTTSNWKLYIQANVLHIVLHSVIIIGIAIMASKFLKPMADTVWEKLFFCLLSIVIAGPILWALGLQKVGKKPLDEIKKDRKYKTPVIIMLVFRMLLAAFFIGFIINLFFAPLITFILLIALLVVMFLFPKKLQQLYLKIASRFIENLNSRERSEAVRNKSSLTPWDGHMTTFEIAQESALAGRTLLELKLRETLGINIAIIKRGELTINVPTRHERLFPKDVVYVIGTDEQIAMFEHYLNANNLSSIEDNDIILQKIELNNEYFIGKTIRETEMRDKIRSIVAGIERDGKRIINPESDFVLKQGDILWLIGDQKQIEALIK
ncbi:cation:proton antiporter [Flavobacterium sp. JP2137]|uniref:cation:proton antiporter domain-containing protein n=1 Tax=Flavobacterium sp. JP2137 TaxID=3414510 RepID=UPI003D2FFD2D